MKDWIKLQNYVELHTDGWQPPGSGSGHIKGDVLTDTLYIECKAYSYGKKPFSGWLATAHINAEIVGKIPILYYRSLKDNGTYEDMVFCRACDIVNLGSPAFYDEEIVVIMDGGFKYIWYEIDPESLFDYCKEKSKEIEERPKPTKKWSNRSIFGRSSWPKRKIK